MRGYVVPYPSDVILSLLRPSSRLRSYLSASRSLAEPEKGTVTGSPPASRRATRMHIGLMMECDYREGRTQREAFDEAFATVEAAEALGFDGVWLSERHFSPPGGSTHVSSIGSTPLLWATAIAMRTSRLRIGTAVLLLPLGHPVRLAEEVETLDNLSQGRFDLGIGRSSFPRSYEGYNVPYEESRARFREYLEVMRLAWTQERFSYAGTFYKCQELMLIPKPYQQPHP